MIHFWHTCTLIIIQFSWVSKWQLHYIGAICSNCYDWKCCLQFHWKNWLWEISETESHLGNTFRGMPNIFHGAFLKKMDLIFTLQLWLIKIQQGADSKLKLLTVQSILIKCNTWQVISVGYVVALSLWSLHCICGQLLSVPLSTQIYKWIQPLVGILVT